MPQPPHKKLLVHQDLIFKIDSKFTFTFLPPLGAADVLTTVEVTASTFTTPQQTAGNQKMNYP